MDTPTSWRAISVGRTAEGTTRELYVCSGCPMKCRQTFGLSEEPPALCDHAVIEEPKLQAAICPAIPN